MLPRGWYLPEREGHRVWCCETGLSGGAPVLVLHGGPGGRTRAAPFAWFDGLPVRCIAFDQRGCGQSTPAGALEHNTLAHLVDDIERLRAELNIDAWGVVGGSWGALVAVAYAAAHPQRVTGLFLRSAFLGGDDEVARFFAPWAAWLGEAGAAWLGAVSASPLDLLDGHTSRVIPARVALAWQAFEAAQAGAGGLHSMPGARFTIPATASVAVSASGRSPDPPLDALRNVSLDVPLSVPRDAPLPAPLPAPHNASLNAPLDKLPTGLAVQAHYLRHHCFVSPEVVATWLDALQFGLIARPVSLVHGRLDAVCHPDVTAALAARWPHAELLWAEGGGHDMDSAPMRRALTEAARAWVAALTLTRT